MLHIIMGVSEQGLCEKRNTEPVDVSTTTTAAADVQSGQFVRQKTSL